MPGGYMGKILNVDLSNGNMSEDEFSEKMLRDFVGGAGLGARVVFNRQKAGVDSLGPENILGFITGPFTGTPVPYSGKYQVVAKSPLTQTWGDANCGGDFGPYLKFAGFDGIFFTGISEEPVYLLIDHGKAEIRDASHFWGKDTFETDNILKTELGGGTRLACIGPSGEKLSLIASVMTEKGRAAGRSGLGAVMGSKRLKAVAVKGSNRVPVVDRDRLIQMRQKYVEKGKNDPITGKLFNMHAKYGNCGLMRSALRVGAIPVKNYGGVDVYDFPDLDTKLGGPAVIAYQEKRDGCWGCPCLCGGRMRSGSGDYLWEAGAHKPEAESMAFGYKCLVGNMEAVIKACDIANRYGFDHSSAAATISFAMECYENGLITSNDTGGIELSWGNDRAVVAITEMMAKREGFGDILADGVKVAAQKIGKGADEYALHVHGQEIDGTDPRPFPGCSLAYVVDATPARHTVGSTYFIEAAPEPPRGLGLTHMPPHVYTGKGEANRRMIGFHNILNATGVCQFAPYHGVIDGENMPELFKAVTGWELTIDDIFEIGDRISSIRMAFNLREGINPIEDFKIPGRVIGHPPVKSGPQKGVEIDLNTMVREYLSAMDWDQVTFKPSRSRLEQLGLEDVAEVLLTDES
jgi:aldehyde:ferredoxin oxidoreductase